jgi:hypothetical protein
VGGSITWRDFGHGIRKYALPDTISLQRVQLTPQAATSVDASSPKSDLDLQKPLERFRANSKRLAVHPVEQVVLWAVSAHLVFLPWALGTMRPWGQITSLVLALIGFVLALIPRSYTEEHTGSNSFRLVMWPRPTTSSSKATISRGRPSDRTKLHDKPGTLECGRSFGSGTDAILSH